MNSPLEILGKFAVIGVIATVAVFMFPQVIMPFVDLALQNPVFAAVIVLSVVFLLLFGEKGDGGAGEGG